MVSKQRIGLAERGIWLSSVIALATGLLATWYSSRSMERGHRAEITSLQNQLVSVRQQLDETTVELHRTQDERNDLQGLLATSTHDTEQLRGTVEQQRMQLDEAKRAAREPVRDALQPDNAATNTHPFVLEELPPGVQGMLRSLTSPGKYQPMMFKRGGDRNALDWRTSYETVEGVPMALDDLHACGVLEDNDQARYTLYVIMASQLNDRPRYKPGLMQFTRRGATPYCVEWKRSEVDDEFGKNDETLQAHRDLITLQKFLLKNGHHLLPRRNP